MRVQLFPVPLRMVERKKDREGLGQDGGQLLKCSWGRTDPNAKEEEEEGKGRREWLMHTKAAERGREKEPPCFSEFKHSEEEKVKEQIERGAGGREEKLLQTFGVVPGRRPSEGMEGEGFRNLGRARHMRESLSPNAGSASVVRASVLSNLK